MGKRQGHVENLGQLWGQHLNYQMSLFFNIMKLWRLFDVEREDRYGRLLAHVFTRSTFVNAELVRRGYARVSTYRPNLKYRDFFLSLQTQAKKSDRGLWGEC